jgi:hypothetical protein
MMKFLKLAAVVGAGLFIAAGSAHATYVPAGTLSIAARFSPVVDLTGDNITLADTSAHHKFDFQGGTGQFLTADSVNGNDVPGVTSSASFHFDPTVGNVVTYSGASALNNLLVFTDTTLNETYSFTLDNSITTLSNQTTGSGTTIGLYLLGDLTATGTNNYATSTPTALTLSLTQTGGSNWSLSGTLANPPPGIGLPVPEPTSMTLLGGSLAALGFFRRRRARK